jgi:energy-coupling factor transport system substrate-specific component
MEEPDMKEKSKAQMILGTWNTQTIVGVAIGAALFGVLMVFGGIKVFTNTSLTSAMVVVAVVAGLYGPLPAAVAAGVGNVIADLIGGWGFWFDWSIGNFVLGFFVGLLPLYGAKIEDGIFELKHAIIYVITVVVGNAIAFGIVTPLLTYLFYSSELTITWLQALSAIISNGLVLIVIGIPILKALASRNARKFNLAKED